MTESGLIASVQVAHNHPNALRKKKVALLLLLGVNPAVAKTGPIVRP